MWARTSLSVSAMCLLSFRHVIYDFLGTGMMELVLKQVGTMDWDSERLNIVVKTSAHSEDPSRYAIQANSFPCAHSA